MSNDAVWLITGCSTGFGRELAVTLLARGRRVVATARDAAKLADLAKTPGASDSTLLRLPLDVDDAASIKTAVAEAEKRFGQIDVLVNNAGYGYFAAIEEGEDEAIRAMFETNVFGLARITQAVLPGMRKRRSGMIVNVSSIGGFVGFPGVGYYNATKFAVEGLSESLAKETKPLGIKVLIVEPGPFRTDWAGRSAKMSETEIDDYAETAGANRRTISSYSGQQPGDPKRGAAAIIEAVESANPPQRLLLGKRALTVARDKLKSLQAEFDAWEKTTLSADFPD